MGDHHRGGGAGSSVTGETVDIYPLSRYYFRSKDAVPEKDETLADRTRRRKSNFEADGLKRYSGGVILVELYKHPHMLLLQVRNSIFKLPGGRLRHGESDVEGLKRKLSSKLSKDGTDNDEWQIGECLGMWWRYDYDTLPLPYPSPNMQTPKECIKVFLVRLPMAWQFFVPKNMKLLAVPLYQIHDSSETYGPVISGIPHLLSRFSFNMIQN